MVSCGLLMVEGCVAGGTAKKRQVFGRMLLSKGRDGLRWEFLKVEVLQPRQASLGQSS
jgi:hypothetical protein